MMAKGHKNYNNSHTKERWGFKQKAAGRLTTASAHSDLSHLVRLSSAIKPI